MLAADDLAASSARTPGSWPKPRRRHPHGIQRLLGRARWDANAVRDDLRSHVAERLGEPGGVLIVDETGFFKMGGKAVGVQWRYSGTARRIENGQVGVFLAYRSACGAAFLNRALYPPKSWAGDAGRRGGAGVPEDVAFATKPELAREATIGLAVGHRRTRPPAGLQTAESGSAAHPPVR